eukprot:TRINITY_DN20730_c1_g2_i1.p2 TRINITY_DN20730_c1_g2~~TRINITY_DN20730_c1_g2_i1.p2  ORF type:complete len:197 (+),score=-1.04 TRINITY_DN20730_c1_g2_i1:136-726(+)
MKLQQILKLKQSNWYLLVFKLDIIDVIFTTLVTIYYYLGWGQKNKQPPPKKESTYKEDLQLHLAALITQLLIKSLKGKVVQTNFQKFLLIQQKFSNMNRGLCEMYQMFNMLVIEQINGLRLIVVWRDCVMLQEFVGIRYYVGKWSICKSIRDVLGKKKGNNIQIPKDQKSWMNILYFSSKYTNEIIFFKKEENNIN